MHVEELVPFPLGAAHADGVVRDEDPLDGDVVRARRAHDHRAPIIVDTDAWSVEGHRQVEDRRADHRIVVHGRRQEQLSRGRATREDLARRDAEATIDLLRLPRSLEPVGAAAGDEDQLLGADAPEQRLGCRSGRGRSVLPLPHGRREQMGVHRERKSGRATAAADLLQHRAQLGMGRAAAAQRSRYPGGEELAGFEVGIAIRHERVIRVVSRRALRQRGNQLARDRDRIEAPRVSWPGGRRICPHPSTSCGERTLFCSFGRGFHHPPAVVARSSWREHLLKPGLRSAGRHNRSGPDSLPCSHSSTSQARRSLRPPERDLAR